MSGMKKCILVTGGGGFIGSHCILELLRDDFDVVVVDNFDNCVKGTSCEKLGLGPIQKNFYLIVFFIFGAKLACISQMEKIIENNKMYSSSTTKKPENSLSEK